jgi:hypothetical protein
MKKLLALATTAVLGLLVAPVTHAQDVYMDMFNSANQAAVSMSLVNINNAAVMASARNAEAEKRGGRAATATAAKRNVSLAYTSTPALRQQTVQNLARQMQAKNASAGQAINNAFGPGKTDYNQLFGQMVQQSGLPANNAATAFAAYLEIAYVAVNGVSEASVTPAMDRAIQRQTTSLLSTNKALTSPTAVAHLGEEMKLQAVVLYLGWQTAKKNGQEAQFKSNLANNFKSKGLDLSALRLTSAGLVKK